MTDNAPTIDEQDPMTWPERCPLCGSETVDGFGLKGGGYGPYRCCASEGPCPWMVKRRIPVGEDE